MARNRAAASTGQRPLSVGHYGGTATDRLAADGRCVPRRVAEDEPGGSLDCLFVEWDAASDPEAAIAAGVQSDVPVVAYDPAGRATRAAAATRAGAAEYVTPAALADETVVDRVVAVATGTDAPGARSPGDAAGSGPPFDDAGSGDAPTGAGADGPGAAERRRFARLFDGLPDAVVEAEFVDGEPVVRSVNEAFEEVFGFAAAEARGEPVNDLLVPDEFVDEAREIDRRAASAGHSIDEVERETDRGRRTFLFRWLRYPTTGDVRRGFGIYTDITKRKRRQRRLRVLHRVLRHNLRNEVTAIKGYVDLIEEAMVVDEPTEYIERLRDRADSIAALGEQAHHIEAALDEDQRTEGAVDPTAAARAVCARYRESEPSATIEFEAPADPPMVQADSLLERAIDAVVENAVEHTDGEPTIDVTVERSGDRWVDVVVSDDGPGIPERERRILADEREITQLDHSMGLGLWVARWVVEGVDGRLTFDDCDDGTTVRLRLLRADASP